LPRLRGLKQITAITINARMARLQLYCPDWGVWNKVVVILVMMIISLYCSYIAPTEGSETSIFISHFIAVFSGLQLYCPDWGVWNLIGFINIAMGIKKLQLYCPDWGVWNRYFSNSSGVIYSYCSYIAPTEGSETYIFSGWYNTARQIAAILPRLRGLKPHPQGYYHLFELLNCSYIAPTEGSETSLRAVSMSAVKRYCSYIAPTEGSETRYDDL